MNYLLIAQVLITTAILHFVPNWTRPDIFFTVTVDPAFRATAAGRAILRRYRIVIWSVAIAAASIQLATQWFLLMGVMLAAGFLGALLTARHQAQAHAATPDPVLEVDLTAPSETVPGGLWGFVLPMISLAALAVVTARGPAPDYTSVAAHAGMCLMLASFAWGILHWSRRVATSGPRAGGERRFRRLVAGYLVLAACGMSVQAWVLQLQPPMAVQYTWFALLGAMISIFVVLLIRSGQGGTHALPGGGAGPPVGDRTPDACWKWGILYFNPADPAVFVEKRFGIGYTFNFGSRWSWALITLVLVPVVIKMLLR